jgi:superfamily II DNA or RNA helicase
VADTQLGIVLRPKNFNDVIGQDSAVAVMRQWVDTGKVPRAVMLVGPAGTGKTTLANILGRAAQGWEFPEDADPDVLEINAANYTGVDDMRELVDSTQSFPMVGKYRVIILDEAHMLSKQAQNLLLKPFEDANSATLWIICTTETAKIIPALVTRCQRFDLTRMTKKNIHDLLVRAAEYLEVKDFSEFEQIAIRENLNQPRPLLNAFGNFANGMPAAEAVNGQLNTYGANVRDIAFSAVHGFWDRDTAVWKSQKNPDGVKVRAMKDLLKELEDEFKKRKKKSEAADATEGEEDIEGEDKGDVQGRPEVSRAIRAIVGGLLKAEVIHKQNMIAADCIIFLANSAPASAFDVPLEYPATVAALFKIQKKMRGEGK